MNTVRWMNSLVKTRPDLYRAIYDWNAYPHRWALPAWLAENAVPAPVVALLERTGRGRQRLGRHFRQALGLASELWDFQAPARRVALLGAPTLARLARFSGASLHHASLARIITRDDRRAVIERIGEDAFLFALRRGRLLHGATELEALAPRDADLPSAIEPAGWRLLAACVEDQAPALRLRFRLKVPRAVTLPPAENLAAHREAAWRFIEPVIRETASPEELRCFV